jgi:hypothetical protein
MTKAKRKVADYSEAVSLPMQSLLSKVSRYEADMPESVLSFISISSENMKWT